MANAVTEKQAKKPAVQRREPSLVAKGLQYVKESWAETRRATWPSWLDIRRLTTAVFAGVIFITLYIWVFDTIFALITRALFGAEARK